MNINNRNIFFKAKLEINNKAWVYGNHLEEMKVKFYNTQTIRSYTNFIYSHSGVKHKILVNTLCQYIEKEDAYGIKIFEKDILVDSFNGKHYFVFYNKYVSSYRLILADDKNWYPANATIKIKNPGEYIRLGNIFDK